MHFDVHGYGFRPIVRTPFDARYLFTAIALRSEFELRLHFYPKVLKLKFRLEWRTIPIWFAVETGAGNDELSTLATFRRGNHTGEPSQKPSKTYAH